MENVILNGDSLTELKKLPDESINCVMTSPPYWALRDYGIDGQLGLESTFEEYINKLCDIFSEVKRVLRKDGTCWVNLGDTFNSHSTGKGGVGGIEGKRNNKQDNKANTKKDFGQIPDKCLTMIPFRFAIEMVNRGWILRNTIIWHKRNCMPSSVKDRFTVDFEYLFFFTKSKKYWFETQYEPVKTWDKSDRDRDKTKLNNTPGRTRMAGLKTNDYRETGRNKRTVWTINPKPFKEAHFAVYPEELCETPIKAGCPEFVCVKCGNPKVLEIEKEGKSSAELMNEKVRGLDNESHILRDKSKFKSEQGQKENMRAPREAFERKIINKGYKPTCSCNSNFTGGIVLDPFFGSGTTGLVALKQNKKFIGIELNKEYIEIANKRLKPYLEQKRL